MKLYVAGIDFEHTISNLSLHAKTKFIINSLPEISRDAETALGTDAVTLVVLQEYALTEQAIPNEEKKKCLNELEKAIKQYKNIILIPGSFAAYEKFSECHNPEERKTKIVNNYTTNSENPLFKCDDLFMTDYLNAKHKYVTEALDDSLCLQNSAYILTSEDTNPHRIKHKKSYPYMEEKKLSNMKNCFFYVGADNPIKEITMNNDRLDIGLTICREHISTTSESEQVKNHLPPLQVIVSDSVRLDKNNLFGAVNIHMDSDTGLTIHINDAHPKSHVINEVKATCYYALTPSNNYKMSKQISHFNHLIGTQVAPATKNNDGISGLRKGFFYSASTDNKSENKTSHTNNSTKATSTSTPTLSANKNNSRPTLYNTDNKSRVKKSGNEFCGFKRGFL